MKACIVASLIAIPSCGAPAPVPAASTASTASRSLVGSPRLQGIAVPHAIPSDIPFVSLEGPFWVASGGYLLFSDVVEENGAAAQIYRYDPGSGAHWGKFSRVAYPMSPTSTNGLALDAEGRLLACERYNGVLARISGNERQVVADHAPGTDSLALNAPNDLTLRADGNIYFSDTTWGARPGPHAPTAVYRVAPDGVVSEALRLEMPNGVVLSPDGKTLYVGSDAQNCLLRLQVRADGTVGPATPFIDAQNVPGGNFHVPDGLCVDDLGRLYVTNNSTDVSAIQVFDPDGRFLGQIALPVPPSNCSFGGADRRTLYVTTLHAIYEVRMQTPGLP